ncbi:hypothetical protein GPZ81_16760 [Burkholderia pseudomallei]|uniref:hypothetical protein n=1 Tax=Burkholderia pseudomallei TaxID=28450 RepID=UPI000F26166A|nr:hypothetical protein [Burkholderia pseudomallei]MWJ56930.1 hypothetical protein [Burkholderia pseudomallei]CAJ4148939.1 Uncharacterised protein [Burkholderia pseudomallei]CAJ4629736.1 Uncharacterised protein [Burkholderia pseudomallei]CAJ4795014.1 Uncharacterised protein [Burkholderia pseudomallei]CAJ5322833.1 Uncharacterised protein [Burkholderia pseudomallei]
MKRAWEIAQLAFVWLLIGVGFFALFRTWAIVAGTIGSKKDFWDIATAVGTCGAVIVALYISGTDRRERRLREVTTAKLTAAGIAFRISLASISIRTILKRVEAAQAGSVSPQSFLSWADMLDSIDGFSRNELVALVPLRGDSARQIAGAMDRVNVAINFLRRAEQARDRGKELSALEIVNGSLSEAQTLFRNAEKFFSREETGLASALSAKK